MKTKQQKNPLLRVVPMGKRIFDQLAHDEREDERRRLRGATRAVVLLTAGEKTTRPMTADEKGIIRMWLSPIKKYTPADIEQVICKCQQDADARAVALAWGEVELGLCPPKIGRNDDPR